MAHTIEVAKSGRAGCRTCKQTIAKGELRFGEEQPNLFGDGPSYAWHHVACAAKKKPHELREALAAYPGEVPDRAALEASIAEHAAKIRPKATAFPHAERAPSARSHCQVCHEAIDKGALRIAVERDAEAGSMVARAAGYLHPLCAVDHFTDEAERRGVLAKLRENSKGLEERDFTELAEALGG